MRREAGVRPLGPRAAVESVRPAIRTTLVGLAVLSAVTMALVTGSAPAGAEGSGLGQPRAAIVAADVDPVTASEVIARATGWTTVDVPYSQTTWYQGYRTDCSGFVSMTWALTSGGQPLSLVTQTLPNVATQIPFSQLMPGDTLIFNSTADPQDGSHAELFGGWVNSSEQYFYVYQESGGGATVSIASFPPAPLDDTSQWYAYQDDAMVEDLPAIPAVPPAVPPRRRACGAIPPPPPRSPSRGTPPRRPPSTTSTATASWWP